MKNHLLALLMISVTAVWGWTFVVVKDAIHIYGVMGFLAVRFLIGAVLIGTVAVWKINLKTVGIGLFVGFALAGGYYLQTAGLKHTSPTNSGLITGLFVLFAPMASRLIFGIKTARLFWVAIAASLLGCVLLAGTGAEPPTFGDLLTLGCAACFGLHIAMLGRYAKEHDATGLAFVQVTTASVLFWLLWPISGDPVSWPTTDVWFALLITGVLATAVGFFVQTYVQQRLPPVRAAVIISAEPLFAAFFGFTLAGDRLTGLQILGAALMIGAVVLAETVSAVPEDASPKEPEHGEAAAEA